MDIMKDISTFLDKNARTDIKLVALNELLGLTGSKEGCISIHNNSDVLKYLVDNLSDTNDNINKSACLVLVNISATNEGTENIINADSRNGKGVIGKLLQHVLNPSSTAADAACMTLSNITRKTCYTKLVLEYLELENVKLHQLLNVFTKVSFNLKGCTLNYLAPFFSNLSQNAEFRRQLMNKNGCLIQKLLPFIHHDSSVRRSGAVATIRNCCFDSGYHDWLLSSEVDILPCLLLPLAGPEEHDDDDMEKLPLELQYLGENKVRESDGNIRKLLLESLHQLCAKKSGREYLRSKNTYIILREYHKWEKDPAILLACENVIDILIRYEEEIGEDNLKELTVPENYIEKFEEMDRQYLENFKQTS